MLLYLVRRFQRFLRNLKILSWCRAVSVGVFENIGEFIQFANLNRNLPKRTKFPTTFPFFDLETWFLAKMCKIVSQKNLWKQIFDFWFWFWFWFLWFFDPEKMSFFRIFTQKIIFGAQNQKSASIGFFGLLFCTFWPKIRFLGQKMEK